MTHSGEHRDDPTDPTDGGSDAGTRLVRALAAKDTQALLGLLADDVVFRGLTPGRFWEASGAGRVIQDVLWRWFEPDDVVEEVVELRAADVAGRARVDYLLRVRNSDGQHLVEQRAYLDLDDAGRVVRLEAFCGGFRPVAAVAAAGAGAVSVVSAGA